MNEDQLILVDLQDNQIGVAGKQEAHEKALMHRAFSVFLYRAVDPEPEMLIQKRAAGKYHSGGLWTNSCCSHPRNHETLDEAVPRRLFEELGVRTEVRERFSFRYYHRFSPEIAEYEFDHVFIGEYNGKFVPNPEEVDELKWVHLSELSVDMLAHPDDYTPWFMIAAPRVMEAVRMMAIAKNL